MKDLPHVISGGLLLGLHWLTYFHALKLSNVATGMLSLFTFPVITLLLEPVILKTKFHRIHLLLGLLILLGIYFLVPEFDFKHSHTKAVGWGVFSAFCYALRNIVLKPKANTYHGSTLMFYQLAITGVVLSPLLFTMDYPGFLPQWKATLSLAIITTATGHTLFMYSLRHFSATSISILSCIQPVYGILLALVFLAEIPSISTIIGGAIIISTVVIESIRTSKTQ
jgi:drug/metabolite transporter (DMT)-like permease